MKIKILSKEQLNEFFNPRRMNNGGGYDQPRYEFEFGGVIGVFEDTSCGEFGGRYFVQLGSESAMWGSMLQDREKYSDAFTPEFRSAFKEAFGLEIPKAF